MMVMTPVAEPHSRKVSPGARCAMSASSTDS